MLDDLAALAMKRPDALRQVHRRHFAEDRGFQLLGVAEFQLDMFESTFRAHVAAADADDQVGFLQQIRQPGVGLVEEHRLLDPAQTLGRHHRRVETRVRQVAERIRIGSHDTDRGVFAKVALHQGNGQIDEQAVTGVGRTVAMQNRYVHMFEFYLKSGSAIQVVGLANHQRGAETLADNAPSFVAEVEQAWLLDNRQHVGQCLVITGREDITGDFIGDKFR
ncbi:hypothetical protein D3C81_1461870 [compost metagenome]